MKKKSRYFNTRFWRDAYINDLDPSEKLLFIHMITNPDANICGIYEIPKIIIACDTGFDVSMLDRLFTRLEKDGKAFYKDGWICMVNTIRHQELESKQIKKGIKNLLEDIPKDILKYFIDNADERFGATINEILDSTYEINKINKTEKLSIEIPISINKKAWDKFIEHRKSIKKPLNNRSAKIALNKFNGVNQKEQQNMVDKCIEYNWVTVFPLNNNSNYDTRNSDKLKRADKRDTYENDKAESKEREKDNEQLKKLRNQQKKLSNRFTE